VNGITRWAAIGLVLCGAAGYGITFGWLGEGLPVRPQATQELAAQELLPNALPGIRRLPPTGVKYLATDMGGRITGAGHGAVQPANYLLPLATIAITQAPPRERPGNHRIHRGRRRSDRATAGRGLVL
jgi:hypothetical protein